VLGTVQLDGEVFRKGVSKVPLTTGMTILDAHQNGKGVPLEQENGTHTALISGPGEFFRRSGKLGFRCGSTAGRASFSLPVPTAGSVQLALDDPRRPQPSRKSAPGLITSPQIGERSHRHRSHTGSGATREHLVGDARKPWRRWCHAKCAFLADAKDAHLRQARRKCAWAVLADVTVVQGEPTQFPCRIARRIRSNRP